MVETCFSFSCSFCSSDRPSHPRHIDIGYHQIDLAIRLQRRQGFNAVAREQEADRSVSYFVAELLQDESLDIRLVVNDQDVRGHAVR